MKPSIIKPELCNSNLLQSRIAHHLVTCSDFDAHRKSDYASTHESCYTSNQLAHTSAFHNNFHCTIRVKHTLWLIGILLWIMLPASANEFNCEVIVNNTQVESGRSNVFDEMENSLEAFINDQNWTELVVRTEERIRCNFSINITEWNRDEDKFMAKIQIQAVRPVFNSGYTTSLINHLDEEVEFEFASHLRLEYVRGSHINEISSIVAFYLYFILGLDMDSFSEDGGTSFFRQAQEVANSAQSSSNPGWQPFDSERNRHGLAHHILEERNANFRKGWYQYHRLGLDKMSEDSEEGRKALLESLETIREFHRRNPNAYILRMFFRSKSSELINAFSRASATERREALDLLQTMDPRNSSEYRRSLR